MATAQATPRTGRTAWARNLAAPVRDFLSTETGSAIVLLGRDRGRAAVGQLAVAGLLRVGVDHRALVQARGLGADRRPARVGQRRPHDVLLPGRRPGGQARARPRRAARPQAPGAAGRRRRSAAWSSPIAIYLAFNAGGYGRTRLGRRDVDRHRLRARPAGAGRAARRDAPACLPAHAGGGRRPVRPARHRHRLQRARLAHGAGHRDRALRRAHRRCASRRSGAPPRRSWSAPRSGSPCSSRASTRRSPGSPSASSRAPTRRRAATSSAPARPSGPSASSPRPSSRAPRSCR